jgi:hypothetical protein
MAPSKGRNAARPRALEINQSSVQWLAAAASRYVFGAPGNERKTMKNVMDIIERFQTQHALQEERDMETSSVTENGAASPSVRNKNSIFETEEVRVGTVAVPGNTEWSPPHDGWDRLIVMLGKVGQLSSDGDRAFPARGTWIPANSNFTVPNETDQTRTLLIVEFNNVKGEALTE